MNKNLQTIVSRVALDYLVGMSVDGWLILAEAPSNGATTSDSNFSRGYLVQKDGVDAFMKVLDLKGATERGLPLDEVTFLTQAHQFEKSVLKACRDARMANVVSMYEAGQCEIVTPVGTQTVYYFALERAPRDVRHSLDLSEDCDPVWKLTILHHTALALTQLHKKRICHQDVKPGNILDFDSTKFKLTDFGRAYSHSHDFPQASAIPFLGEFSYAPPEYLYGFTPADSIDQREGADAYLLGSLIGTLFCGMGATAMLMNAIPEEISPFDNPVPRFGDVVPHLISAHSEVLIELAQHIPPAFCERLTTAYGELTHPDPSTRGHPDARRSAGRGLGLDRYVSLFDRLRHVARIKVQAIGVSDAQAI